MDNKIEELSVDENTGFMNLEEIKNIATLIPYGSGNDYQGISISE
jgi:hypothetical protein